MPGYTTPNLGLGFLSETQAGKATSVNEALLRLDAVAQASVRDWTLATPPASPAEGDRYVVPPGATGAWAGKSGALAAFYGSWRFFAPKRGWTVYCEATAGLLQYTGAAWAEGAGVHALGDLSDVDATGATAGQVLTRGADGTWRPEAPASSSPSVSLDDLTDVALGAASGRVNGALVAWDAAAGLWRDRVPHLADAVDVADTAPSDGQVLAWDAASSSWKPATPAAGGGGATGEIFAWLNYCGTPGSQGVRASKNIAAVTNVGYGSYRIDFATPAPDLNYAVVFGGRFDTAATDATVTIASESRVIAAQGNSRSLTGFRVITGYQGGGGYDVDTLSIIVVR